jgi:hypothetical protein
MIYILACFLPLIITSKYIAQWKAANCEGPADVLVPLESFRDDSNIWSIDALLEGVCGMFPKPTELCCTGLLENGPFLSLAILPEDTQQPKSRYCKLNSSGISMYYSDSMGCAGGVWCFNDTVRIFNSGDCLGDYESIKDEGATARFGNVSVSMTQVSGSLDPVWIAYVPTKMLVPKFSGSAGDWIGTCSLAIALFVQCLLIAYETKCYFRTRRRFELYKSLMSIYWAVGLLFVTYYYFTVFETTDTLAIFAQVAFMVMNSGTLLPVIHTLSHVMHIKKVQHKRRKIMTAAVILIHFGLGGCYYIQYGMETNQWVNEYQYWKHFYPGWILFSLMILGMPIVMSAIRIVTKRRKKKDEKAVKRRTSIFDKIEKVLNLQKMLTFQLVFYLVSLLGYIAYLLYVNLFSELLGNDLNILGFIQVPYLFQTLLYMTCATTQRSLIKVFKKKEQKLYEKEMMPNCEDEVVKQEELIKETSMQLLEGNPGGDYPVARTPDIRVQAISVEAVGKSKSTALNLNLDPAQNSLSCEQDTSLLPELVTDTEKMEESIQIRGIIIKK